MSFWPYEIFLGPDSNSGSEGRSVLALAPDVVPFVGGERGQNDGMVFVDAGGGEEGLLEFEISLAIVIKIERDFVAELDRLVRMRVNNLGFGWMG